LPGLKTIVYGGGPMYVADCQAALARFGNVMVQIYGQGESPMTITCLPRADHADTAHPRRLERLASVGPAFTGVEVRVAGADDEALPPGEIGEMLVRGDTVMAGYWSNVAATAETLRNGWLHTGDVGSMDADGLPDAEGSQQGRNHLRRLQHLPARSRGSAAAPPGGGEVSVVGQADAEWGEIVIAFIVPRGPAPRHGGTRRPVPRQHRALQAAQALCDGRGACPRTTPARC
jgi:long-chain acyl-CoA synthetase